MSKLCIYRATGSHLLARFDIVKKKKKKKNKIC